MFYAINDNNERVSALAAKDLPRVQYHCPICEKTVRLRAGTQRVSHYAHISNKECDSFAHEMTPWHLGWQSKFPEAEREVVLESNGERHRADVLHNGVAIEFQHSPISETEFWHRSIFYTNAARHLLWVFDERSRFGKGIIEQLEDMGSGKRYCWHGHRPTFCGFRPKLQPRITLVFQFRGTDGGEDVALCEVTDVGGDPPFSSFESDDSLLGERALPEWIDAVLIPNLDHYAVPPLPIVPNIVTHRRKKAKECGEAEVEEGESATAFPAPEPPPPQEEPPTFSIPTGTVWNVELRTDGLPVQLALEAGAGIFADNAEDFFASSLLEEEQQANMPSDPTDPQPPPGGSRGGSAKLYAPCIFLEPAMKAIHCDETVTVCAKCIPDTPSLVGRLNWSFDPDYMSSRVEVADNKMSAIVSNMDAEWHSSVTLHATKGDSLSTSAIIYFCSGHNGCPTNQVSFPPNHTNVTINPVFRKCDHPFNDVIGDGEDEPTCFLEVEAGRETAAGWQHLAWIDTDPGTSGVQRRTAISRDTPPTLNWNMKADTAQPLSDGTDSFVYDDKTTFARALPAVTAGQYVPPPFATIISRTLDDNDNLISEFSTTLAIPQYVKITWDNSVLDEFRQPIVFDYPGASDLPPTNVTLFAGCTAAEGTAAFSGIAAKVQNLFPQGANIVVVGPDTDVPQPHKTIVIQSGRYTNPSTGGYTIDLGRTPNEHCHQYNDSPSGTSYVFDGMIREYLFNGFKGFYLDEEINTKNDWRNVPLPFFTSTLMEIFAQVVMHESCHTVGLVPTASAKYNGHNNCTCGRHYMDRGKDKYAPMRLGFIPQYTQGWMTNNTSYLEFVFPNAP